MTGCTLTAPRSAMIYKTLAHYYDALVHDDEATRAWVDWVEEFHPGKKFLELACGSGEITCLLAQNHQVTAMDLSADMVAEAAKKDLNLEIEFRTGDMRNLENYGRYDAIGCFCDSFNYLLTDEDVRSFFKQVHDHLVPSGLFFFDTHSMDRLEEFASDYTEAGNFEDGTQIQWNIASEDDIIYQDFAFYFPDHTIQEHHMQRVYDPTWLMETLDTWFDILSVRTDWDQEGIAEGEKYFFVCRRKED